MLLYVYRIDLVISKLTTLLGTGNFGAVGSVHEMLVIL